MTITRYTHIGYVGDHFGAENRVSVPACTIRNGARLPASVAPNHAGLTLRVGNPNGGTYLAKPHPRGGWTLRHVSGPKAWRDDSRPLVVYCDHVKVAEVTP